MTQKPRHLWLLVVLLLGSMMAGCAAPEDTTNGSAPGGPGDSEQPGGEPDDTGASQTRDEADTSESEGDQGAESGTNQSETEESTISDGGSNMEFVDKNSYRDDIGYFHVVGLVKNTGSANASYVSIEAEFKDANGNVVDTSTSFSERDIVPAGEQSPFELQVQDDQGEIASYELAVSSRSTDDSPVGDRVLQTQGVTTAQDSIGYYHVKGEVSNNGDRPARSVEVIGALLDQEGTIQGVSFTFTNPEDIDAGATASFDLQEDAEQRSFSEYRLWIQPASLGERGAESGSPSGPQMEIVSNNSYRDDIGYFNVVGLAENTGGMNGSFIEVSGTFYDSNGDVVQTSSTFGARDITPSGEETPFHLQVQDDNAEIVRYKLDISAKATDNSPPGDGKLSTQGTTKSTDSIGYVHVRGEVVNEASKSAKSVQVIGAFYNEAGEVVGTEFTYTDPDNIPAGETASFDLQSDPGDRAYSSYELWISPRAMG